ncbi:hypothetical protein ACVWZA_001044 [Sphingomonas sp. UYAg733]
MPELSEANTRFTPNAPAITAAIIAANHAQNGVGRRGDMAGGLLRVPISSPRGIVRLFADNQMGGFN